METHGDTESKTSPTRVHRGFPYGLKTAKFNLETEQQQALKLQTQIQ